ncbi:amidohydrolase family protein [Defluviitalea phaphyphila]|uniref:amidohydrolase family protein n=1 Tax=Defluviitalea phaphyphila TaxID=1473580 RepID=UPI000731493E|nr:amidohydrolase family protein [Defluviitalea phaphyphila]
MNDLKILKGNFIFTKEKDFFEIHEKSFLIIKNKRVLGIYKNLPKKYEPIKVKDYKDAIIIPSFVDLHVHAPQYLQQGVGLDLELIDWLNKYTFENEMKFVNENYAKKIYSAFVKDLYDNGTLRSCIFGTIHNNSNQILIEEIKKRKISAFVGKVNMDQNAPENLLQTTDDSLKETIEFIDNNSKEDLIKPIITPRFAPSCSLDLLKKLGDLSVKKKIPVQTHLSENKDEVKWVKSLFPSNKNYSDVYLKNQLYGMEKTIMAHAIYLEEEEIKMAKNKNVYLVHCPDANINLSSGIMPVTKYLDMGIQVGLGSDVGAGHMISMTNTIKSAIQSSKIRHIFNNNERILTESEAFYLATKLNGSFFGKTGSFEKGYLFDAIVIDSNQNVIKELSPLEKLERFIYCGDKNDIIARYLEGEEV